MNEELIGKRLTGRIEDCTEDGAGVVRHEGLTIFVTGGLPGDEVAYVITGLKKNHAIGRVEEILSPSENRVQPECIHAETCGGCTLQGLKYPFQLELKHRRVENAMKRIGGVELEVQPIIGADESWAYRNKAYFQVQRTPSGEMAIGFHQSHSKRVVDVTSCRIVQPELQEAANVVRKRLGEFVSELVAEDARSIAMSSALDSIKGLMVRQSIHGKLMVVLCVDDGGHGGKHHGRRMKTDGKTDAHGFDKVMVKAFEKAQRRMAHELVVPLQETFGSRLSSVWLNRSKKNSALQMGFENLHLYGEETLTDGIFDVEMRLSPLSFTQVNPKQTEKLYNEVFSRVPKGADTVLDVYCGIGAIGLTVAKRTMAIGETADRVEQVMRLVGIESVPEAVKDAEENAKRNGIENATFHMGAAEAVLPKLVKAGLDFDVAIVDPPRKGCDKALLDAMMTVGPKTIIYVSCDPSTLARDMKVLAGSYDVKDIQPVDLFPHSMHVESVVKLEKR